ncbi:DedA family protein [Actinotalea sp.]|uniref:DedA family protein n=1 Tax=Actinotalea sp. TaxID=1872145 RepID=UPI0035645CAC
MDAWLLSFAASPLVYFGMFVFAVIDGFFPPMPSEAAIVGLAALTVAGDSPDLTLLLISAVAGVFVGDLVAYEFGRRIDVHRLPMLRTGRGARTVRWAEDALENRGTSFILAARFIPVARVAVNVSAGALGYPRRRYLVLAAIGSVIWAAYSAAIGIGAGAWFEGHPVAAVLAAVVGGLAVGVGLDQLMSRRMGPRAVATGDGDVAGDSAERADRTEGTGRREGVARVGAVEAG